MCSIRSLKSRRDKSAIEALLHDALQDLVEVFADRLLVALQELLALFRRGAGSADLQKYRKLLPGTDSLFTAQA